MSDIFAELVALDPDDVIRRVDEFDSIIRIQALLRESISIFREGHERLDRVRFIVQCLLARMRLDHELLVEVVKACSKHASTTEEPHEQQAALRVMYMAIRLRDA